MKLKNIDNIETKKQKDGPHIGYLPHVPDDAPIKTEYIDNAEWEKFRSDLDLKQSNQSDYFVAHAI